MSVCKSDEKLLIFESLISPNNIIFLRSNIKHLPLFHHQEKHLEVRQKYSAARRIFNPLCSVFHLVMKHCLICKRNKEESTS